ncbi:MAG: MoaD/ThiS family protein [archaeon]
MKVFIEREDRETNIKAKTVKELLKKLNINPVTVIVAKNNELVTDDDKLTEKDEVKLISVISGG